MATAEQFSGMGASVFPSQKTEIVISKQPGLADYNSEVRSALTQLPPEVSRALLGDYSAPTQSLVTQMQDAIMQREPAVENLRLNVDQQWLTSADNRLTNEASLRGDDEWNGPTS